MKHLKIAARRDEWTILGGTKRSQAAVMSIAPGESEGGPDNRHDGDQWLLVLSGRGTAHVGKRRIELRRGSLLLIEAGERHEIVNDGRAPLRTLNLYAPPQYDARGEEL